MSDSILDEAMSWCRDTLVEAPDAPTYRDLRARLGILERASWSLDLQPATQEQVVSLAKLVLDLRDDVARACPSDRAKRDLHAAPTTPINVRWATRAIG